MKKINYFLFILVSIISSCETQKDNNSIGKIMSFQNKAVLQKDSTYYFLLEAKKLLGNNIPDSLKTKNYVLFGNYYKSLNKKDSAYHYYNKAIQFSKDKITTDKDKMQHLNLAYYYKKNGDYLNSLSVLNKLEKGIKNQNDYKTLAAIYNQKQSIYKLLKDYKQAIKFNKKSVTYFALAKDTSKLVNSLILQSSLNYYNFHNKKETYRLLDSILTIDLQNSQFKNILKNQVYQNYGIFKYYDGDYQASYANYFKAIQFLKNPQTRADSLALANTYANIAEVSMDLKKYHLAKKYNDAVDAYAKVLDINLNDFHLQNKLRLSYNTKQPFNMVSKNLSILSKKMNSDYKNRITKELTALKEANKKEKELLIANQKVTLHNANLKRKQIILFSVLGFLFLSTLLGIQYYRQKKLKFEKEEIFMQQRLFRAQMNPHFTSNILYTIQDLILENKEKANKYLIKFSRLLRLNLENSMQDFTVVEKEIEVLSKYLDLQQLRMPNKFDYEITTNDLETDLLAIPPMLIQPFVENAIKHGFKNIDYKGKININLTEKGKYIHCEISDNGIGLQATKTDKAHRSASTLLIKKLLKNMINQEVSIQNKKEGKGTVVTFNIPFKEI